MRVSREEIRQRSSQADDDGQQVQRTRMKHDSEKQERKSQESWRDSYNVVYCESIVILI